MEKKNKILLIIYLIVFIILTFAKISNYLNSFSLSPIEHHTLSDAANCAEKVIKSSNIYTEPINVKCDCDYFNKNDYYKYTCNCQITKKADNTLLQSRGSRILYEEEKTYKLKYNFWINENKWYTGYCEKLTN